MVDAAELQRGIEESIRQDNLGAEYRGNSANVIKNLAERIGLGTKAITLAKKFFKRPPAKRDAELIDILNAWHAMGFFSSEALMEGEGVRDHFLRIAEEIGSRPPMQRREAEQASEDLDVVLH